MNEMSGLKCREEQVRKWVEGIHDRELLHEIMKLKGHDQAQEVVRLRNVYGADRFSAMTNNFEIFRTRMGACFEDLREMVLGILEEPTSEAS